MLLVKFKLVCKVKGQPDSVAWEESYEKPVEFITYEVELISTNTYLNGQIVKIIKSI